MDQVTNHTARAAELTAQFSAKADRLQDLLSSYNYVLPARHKGLAPERAEAIAENDVVVFETTSAMFGALRALHDEIRNNNHLGVDRNKNPYAAACDKVRARFQTLVDAGGTDVLLSAGEFQGNIWLIAKTFLTPPNMDRVAKTQDMLDAEALAARRAEEAIKKAAKKKPGKKSEGLTATRPAASRAQQTGTTPRACNQGD